MRETGGKGGGWPTCRNPQRSPSHFLFSFNRLFLPMILSHFHVFYHCAFLYFYLFPFPSNFCYSFAVKYSVPAFLLLSPSPSQEVIDSPSVHLSWKRRRRQCDVIHLAGDGGSAASLITGPINLTHRGRISAAVRQQTHMACLPAEDFLLYLVHRHSLGIRLRHADPQRGCCHFWTQQRMIPWRQTAEL